MTKKPKKKPGRRSALTEAQRKKIVEMSKKKDVTQAEIARRLGVSQPTICRIVAQAKKEAQKRAKKAQATKAKRAAIERRYRRKEAARRLRALADKIQEGKAPDDVLDDPRFVRKEVPQAAEEPLSACAADADGPCLPFVGEPSQALPAQTAEPGAPSTVEPLTLQIQPSSPTECPSSAILIAWPASASPAIGK